MKKIFFILSIILIFASPLFAGELYSCKDRQGNSIVTSAPQDGMTDCTLKDSYEEPAPVPVVKKYTRKYEDLSEEDYLRKEEEKQKQKEIVEAKNRASQQRIECQDKCAKDYWSCAGDCSKYYTKDYKQERECKKSCSESQSRCRFNNGCQ
jgi:hypothetical protein